MKRTLIETLHSTGASQRQIVLIDAGQSSVLKTTLFSKAYPGRYFNIGMANENAIGVASGLARLGKVPFIGTYGDSLLAGAFEEIRSNIAIPNLPVKIFGVYPYGNLDLDIAMMRLLPNMQIFAPADEIELRQVIRKTVSDPGPCYIRVCDQKSSVLYDRNYEFRVGKGNIIIDGDDIGIIATGFAVSASLEAANKLKGIGNSVRLVSMCSLNPIDEDLIIETARKCKILVVCEDNSATGLGEIVSNILISYYPKKFYRILRTENVYEQIVAFIKQI